ncbi:hypothetical protein BGZ83_000321 [Gryganskiella cystojenkinii]|nr:hypothetical protein BGZ83_000321 [Gryganskiella cystojenkinii]
MLTVSLYILGKKIIFPGLPAVIESITMDIWDVAPGTIPDFFRPYLSYMGHTLPAATQFDRFLQSMEDKRGADAFSLPAGLTPLQFSTVAARVQNRCPNLKMLLLYGCALEAVSLQQMLRAIPVLTHLRLESCTNVNLSTLSIPLAAQYRTLQSIQFKGNAMHHDQAAWDALTKLLILVEGMRGESWLTISEEVSRSIPTFIYDQPATATIAEFLKLLSGNKKVICLGLPWYLTKTQFCTIATKIDGRVKEICMLQIRRCVLESVSFQDILGVIPTLRHLKLVDCTNVDPLTIWGPLVFKGSKLQTIRLEGPRIHQDQNAWDLLTMYVTLVGGGHVIWEKNALVFNMVPIFPSPWPK